ncbi:helix-turn-helix domain-containing protein [Actinoplanes sp. TFC3]|uniref:helix-turn-helix domain-containing protein n=1 Tax=Actinoplanes sp. TFC3 TaxID=1710355 RepID=UPI000B0E5CC9|nr:helix-turn-helix domain-containing protein [Actinoplanes sp. TFC3]
MSGNGSFPNAPRPESIKTAADLALQLRGLRLSAHPRLSLSAFAQACGLPKTTVWNAERGSVIPRSETVHLIAVACHQTGEQLVEWTRARERAERYQRGRPNSESSANEARWLTQMDAPRLAARLTREQPASAAHALELIPPDLAAECLSLIEPLRAAAVVVAMDPIPAVRLLSLMDRRLAVERLGDRDIAAVFISMAEPSVAAEALLLMPVNTAASAVGSLESEAAAQCILELPAGLWSPLLINTPRGFLKRVEPLLPGMTINALRAQAPEAAAEALSRMNRRCAVVRIMRMEFPELRAIFSEMRQEDASELLSAFVPGLILELLPSSPKKSQFVANLLMRMEVSVSAGVLASVVPDAGSRWFAAMLENKPTRAIEVLMAMSADDAGSLCRELADPKLVEQVLAVLPAGSPTAQAIIRRFRS